MDAEKTLPKETMALIKEMQMFVYGSFTDDFYIMVSTSKLKTPTEIDLTKVMDGVAKMMQLQGASNILFKQEEFNAGQNLKGQKAFGTMSVTNPITQKTTRAYYEIVFFKQEQGLQQIMVFRKDDDTYGKQILDRIIKSVELKEAN
jgi:hypothetical protein